MVALGYALSSEEHAPRRLVQLAEDAEKAGFEFALLSDHFHPWTDRQGESAFAWTALGAILDRTDRLRVGTGVTCPIIRYHPAVVAQAAATAASMAPGRFFLGVGTGEALNEHVTGERWPSADERLGMLAEAVEVMRRLWEGDWVSHHGDYFRVEDARLYSLPEDPPQVMVAASGSAAAEYARAEADGLISTSPDEELVKIFSASGVERPRFGQLTVCWAESEAAARATAREWWPNAALPGQLGQELPRPEHFEQATALATEEDVAGTILCGPDPSVHLDGVRKFAEAGFDHVYLHQVGPDQEGFFEFCAREILPRASTI